MRFFFFILLISFFASFYSQFKNENTLPDRYYISIPDLKDKIEKNIPSKFKEGKLLHISHEFANNQAYIISKYITEGDIYTNNLEFENYLNEVLKTVLPPELKNNSDLKVYLVKQGRFNASMGSSGHLFLNIGVFSKINDEATLASILSHEVVHYYKNHLIQAFIHEEKKTFENYLGSEKVKSKFYNNNELEADSLSFLWVDNSGYSTLGCLENYRIIERLEKQLSKQGSFSSESENITPSIIEVKLKKIKYYINSSKNKKGKLFLVSEDKFHQFKNEAKEEILKQLLNNQDYAEYAFIEHAKKPKEKKYIYFKLSSNYHSILFKQFEQSVSLVSN